MERAWRGMRQITRIARTSPSAAVLLKAERRLGELS